MNAFRYHVKGRVQGVGFRPFIFKIAQQSRVHGWVRNSNDGVHIHVEGPTESLVDFDALLRGDIPPAAEIIEIFKQDAFLESCSDFVILTSEDYSDEVTQISPDLAVCCDCLWDMAHLETKKDYPFINCTQCGPRFSIIRDLPYDRRQTTMSAFVQCRECQAEYDDVNNRRFHAQPNACSACGPQYALHGGTVPIQEWGDIKRELVSVFQQGGLVAMKGLGGFHLACDAKNELAVARLRTIKKRDNKPFAVMFADIPSLLSYVHITPTEQEQLESMARPVVLLKKRVDLAPSVTMGLDTLGVMLPYLPLHFQLFAQDGFPSVIVMTSGNLSDEPVIIDNTEALKILAPLTDKVLLHNRDIFNRADDSVIQVVAHRPQFIRRSRGYVPTPIPVKLNVDGLVSLGAEQKNVMAFGIHQEAIFSQHIGDVKNYETYRFFEESYERFVRMFRLHPTCHVHDLHPNFLSTRFALEHSIPSMAVQHHHAHVASVMAEYGLDEPVIGVCFDGTGYGVDGTIWGGEFLIADLAEAERVIHLDNVPLVGGDKAADEPWRMAITYLHHVYGKDLWSLPIPFLSSLPDRVKAQQLVAVLGSRYPALKTSSMGRLFDAVSALLTVCGLNRFEAEAAIRLESLICPHDETHYPFDLNQTTVDMRPMIRSLVDDIQQRVDISVMSARFHNTVVAVIVQAAQQIRASRNIEKIVLSGGTFQNRYLIEKTNDYLRLLGFEVYLPRLVPANDGGIALGQLAVAAKRRQRICV